ncbi:MAG TPA: 1,4-dihydroxy-6-naphthoate synthase [Agriterribacter sp.]|nr:1,4-dihydroxy-6-naphthoate synthase [Agriterribacter sp.]
MTFTLGFSPCPNDTFIFDALVNHKIDTEGIEFDVIMEDVQTLNQWAIEGRLDISKISYAVLPLVLQHYIMLNSGGALGKGVGPLLITHDNIHNGHWRDQINEYTIAIPGEDTTAHLLFSLAFPKAKKKLFKVFSEIENFLLDPMPGAGKTAGVIIHENRFTYQEKGLFKLMDLGEFWESQTGYPIPLGGIAVRRDFDNQLQIQLDRLVRQSIIYAFNNYPLLPGYIKQNAQEMNEDVMRRHIDLYVNDYSLHLGEDGKQAVMKFIEIFEEGKRITLPKNNIFVIS